MKKAILPYIISFIIIAILAILALSSCNPVKQVLKNESKMRQVWEKGVLNDWCVNDTTFINNSDTTIAFDTLYSIDYITDTLRKDSLVKIYEIKYVTKTVQIKDTFKVIVTDRSKEQLLQKEISKRDWIISNKDATIEDQKKTIRSVKQSNIQLKFSIILICALFLGIIFRKQIASLFIKLFSPIKFKL